MLRAACKALFEHTGLLIAAAIFGGTISFSALIDPPITAFKLCFAALGLALPVGVLCLIVSKVIRSAPASENHCLRCGYDLSGLTHDSCPECGCALVESLPRGR